MRLRTSAIAIIAIALMMAGGWAVSQTRADARTPLAEAMDSVPADARVAGFTDWAGIRKLLGSDPVASAADRDTLVGDAFKRDLSSRSIMENFAEPMDKGFGWSVADLRWEMYSQATHGAVLTAGLDTNVAKSTVTGGLESLGYAEDGDVWSLPDGKLTSVLPGLPGTFRFAAYFSRDRLIAFSDNADYLAKIATAHRHHGRTLAGVAAARDVAAPLVGSLSAAISVKADACKSTGLADQPSSVRSQGRNVVRPLGTLSTYRYGGRAIFDDGDDAHLAFSMTFSSGVQATRQMALRTALTRGPYVGGTGQVTDVLQLRSAHVEGSTGTFDFGFTPNRESFMTGVGPLLFAACSV